MNFKQKLFVILLGSIIGFPILWLHIDTGIKYYKASMNDARGVVLDKSSEQRRSGMHKILYVKWDLYGYHAINVGPIAYNKYTIGDTITQSIDNNILIGITGVAYCPSPVGKIRAVCYIFINMIIILVFIILILIYINRFYISLKD